MKSLPLCLLYTRDAGLTARVQGMLALQASVEVFETSDSLDRWFRRNGETVLLLDMRRRESCDLISYISREWPDAVLIAMGPERSDPMRYAEDAGVFALEELEPGLRDFQMLIKNAFAHLQLARENRMLKSEVSKSGAVAPAGSAESQSASAVRADASVSLQHFSRALQNFENVSALYESVIEALIASARVTRAGLFCASHDGSYEFRAGIRCLEGMEKIRFTSGDPFIHWLEINAHLVARSSLEHVADLSDRMMLKSVLNRLGAELLIPLHAYGRIRGWVFAGQRVTGVPFSYDDFEGLIAIAEHISSTLEKALNHEEVAMQKALAHTLLDAIPAGIVAVGENAMIRWYNDSARQILGTPPEEVLGRPAGVLGSRLSDMLRRALGGEEIRRPVEWEDPATRLRLSGETRRLMNAGTCVGAVALLKDITLERQLEEKERLLERAAFWNELAASMSHEIRNPLVAIRTFAQLLPERYEDEEFRQQFGAQVVQEVDRLNAMVDQIHNFANPPKPRFEQIDLRRAVQMGVDRALSGSDGEGLDLKVFADEKLPPVFGDEAALADCVFHLVMNAIEALAGRKNAKLELSVQPASDKEGRPAVRLVVADNAGGMDEQIRGNLFSPFCTTKARGMGLGLPIVKRTVVDHDGMIDIDVNSEGTRCSLVFPVKPEAQTHE